MVLSITREDNTVSFKGELNRDTLMLHSPFAMLNALSGRVTFDMGNLTSADTAGLAWLIQQLALSRKKSLVVELRNVPAQLLSLADVSAVTGLLPIID
ncbi:STAS domain-containing protein [Chromatiaceae bacterium AAb-1]|nr:STAS domain-containing protein [Chromatiaceae bacterium AAb-1]